VGARRPRRFMLLASVVVPELTESDARFRSEMVILPPPADRRRRDESAGACLALHRGASGSRRRYRRKRRACLPGSWFEAPDLAIRPAKVRALVMVHGRSLARGTLIHRSARGAAALQGADRLAGIDIEIHTRAAVLPRIAAPLSTIALPPLTVRFPTLMVVLFPVSSLLPLSVSVPVPLVRAPEPE
jgi:hypothetical protein